MRTRIASESTDEVKHSPGPQVAESCSGRRSEASSAVLPPDVTHVVRRHDPDRAIPPQTVAILRGLLTGAPSAPVAVDDSSPEEEEVALLRANGAVVSRAPGLTPACRLFEVSHPSEAPRPVEGHSDEGKPEELVDVGELCSLVRSLASRAHRTLTRTTGDQSEELLELRQQLNQLQTQLEHLRFSHALRFVDLQRWLDCLLHRVQ
jgi:hypothetical protein